MAAAAAWASKGSPRKRASRAADALCEQVGEVRHLTFGQQRIDHLPIGRVPTDQKEPAHAAFLRAARHRRSPVAPRARAARPLRAVVEGSGVEFSS